MASRRALVMVAVGVLIGAGGIALVMKSRAASEQRARDAEAAKAALNSQMARFQRKFDEKDARVQAVMLQMQKAKSPDEVKAAAAALEALKRAEAGIPDDPVPRDPGSL